MCVRVVAWFSQRPRLKSMMFFDIFSSLCRQLKDHRKMLHFFRILAYFELLQCSRQWLFSPKQCLVGILIYFGDFSKTLWQNHNSYLLACCKRKCKQTSKRVSSWSVFWFSFHDDKEICKKIKTADSTLAQNHQSIYADQVEKVLTTRRLKN